MSDPKPPGRLRKDLRYPLPGLPALQGVALLGRRLSPLPEDIRKMVFVSSDKDLGEIEAALRWFREVTEHLAQVERERAGLRTRSFAIGIWRTRSPFLEYPSARRGLAGPAAPG
jgi:hypothetical protein